MAQPLGKQDESTSMQMLERRVRELSTLHEIARAVTSVLDLEAVFNRIVEAAVYLTNAEEGFLLLVDEETGDLILRAGKGLGEKAARGMSLKVTDSIAGQVVKTGRPIRMGGFQHDEKYKVKTGYLVKSLVNVPIKSAGRVIGVLSVDHSVASMRTFSDHDVALLSSLANYAAIAIENARLFAQASAKASELEAALKEKADTGAATLPSEQELQALEQFVEGLRAQREEVLRGIERARQLAEDLRAQAENAEEMVRRLGAWNEEVQELLPQLEWLAQTGLPRGALSPGEAPLTPVASRPPDGQLLEHLAEGVLWCDAKGIIQRANEAAAKILGKSASELLNTDLQAVVEDTRWQRMVGSLRLALALDTKELPAPLIPETTLYINEQAIHAKLIPIYERESETTYIAALFHDISAETEGWRAYEGVLADLSQKLRGPMTAIASYSDLLLGDTIGVVDSMQRRYLQRIQQGVRRIEAVLNELSTETAFSARRITPILTLSLTEVINEAVDVAEKALALDGVNITRDIGDDLPPVQIDSECINHVLNNLLTAAGKRTGVGDSISVRTQVQVVDGHPSHLVVLIQDGGASPPGVPPLEEDETIQAARSLAEDEGGRIWVERQEDGSDLISFLLPVVGQSPGAPSSQR